MLNEIISNPIKVKCDKCDNELSFKYIEWNKWIVYCDICYHFYQYYFCNKGIRQFSLSNESELTCEKCGKVFCMKCYLEHEDYIDKLRIRSIKYRVKNSHYKTKKITIKTYLPYKIKCDRCNRHYNEGRFNHNIKEEYKMNFENIINNYKKAKEHFNLYYTQKKNKLIEELQNKITLIEKKYQQSLSYHQNIFQLIEQLIFNYNETHSKKSLYNLKSICNFNFSTLEDNKNKLDTKINNYLSFLSNEYIITNKSSQIDKMKCTDCNVSIKNSLSFVCSEKEKVIFYKSKGCNIKYIYDDNFFMKILPPKNKYFCKIQELNSNQLLCIIHDIVYSLALITFTKTTYKYTPLPKNYESSKLFKMLILKDNNILTLSYDNEMLIINPKPPYNILHREKLPPITTGSFIQLRNENLVFAMSDAANKCVVFYDYKLKKVFHVFEEPEKKHCYRCQYNIQELSNGNLVFEMIEDSTVQLLIMNTKSYSIDTIIISEQLAYFTPQTLFPDWIVFSKNKDSKIIIYDYNSHSLMNIKIQKYFYSDICFLTDYGVIFIVEHDDLIERASYRTCMKKKLSKTSF